MIYSPYCSSDADKVTQLFITTFSDSEGPAEGERIGRLAKDLVNTTDKNDLYCFVARDDARIAGSIFFSRIKFACGIHCFILAPVAVRTDLQGRGIGQQLINYGIDALSKDGVELVLTYGDPAFYSKVGFRPVTIAMIPAPMTLQHPEGWLARSLTGKDMQPITGPASCVKALNKPEYW
jgi:putative acetyltransferase